MLVAIFPAVMYFFSVFVMVHYEAKRHNVVGEKHERGAVEILKNEWIYIMPLVIITIFMLTGFSPAYSAILGLATCIAVSFKTPETRIDLTLAVIMAVMIAGGVLLWALNKFAGPDAMKAGESLGVVASYLKGNKLLVIGAVLAALFHLKRKAGKEERIEELKRFVVAARSGAESSLKIGATVGVIGIIIGVLTFSGLVLTFADIVIEMAGGSLHLTILLIALASLVLGMGVPVTAAYLVPAVVAVPALIHLGVNELAAHMIVYWLSQDSNITPPVCIAAFAGATIAGANMWKTAFSAFKFAKFLYLGPLLFGYVPGFSLNGSSWDIIQAFVYIIIGTYIYAWFMSGIWIRSLRNLFSRSAA
jgi:TRAP-type uncharacterized transport system fused permease subunit